LAAGLSLVQKRVAPSAELFFLPSSFGEEVSYVVWPGAAASALRRAGDLAESFLFSNLAAPALHVERAGERPPKVRFGARRLAGWSHATLWVALLLVAGYGLWRRGGPGGPLLRALLLWIAFNASLHFFYGEPFFLYSCHWTFAVLAVAAMGVEAGGPARIRPVVPLLLVVMAGLQAWANGSFLVELLGLYR
jgi:hypothetical protein